MTTKFVIGERASGHCSTPTTADPDSSHRRCSGVWDIKEDDTYVICACPEECHDPEQVIANYVPVKYNIKSVSAKPRERRTFEPKENAPECLCGCGEKTRGGKFRPGHDSRLKSSLVKTAQGKNKREAKKAVARLTELGWEKFIP